MKRDSQADALEQWTLLPGERELLANKSMTTGSASQCFSVSSGAGALSASRARKYPERLCQLGPYFAPGDTNVFARPN